MELSCLKNKGGRFIELCDYHSGSQQGNLRIPEGKGGTGWARFNRELRRFFLREKVHDSVDWKAAAAVSKTRNSSAFHFKPNHDEQKLRKRQLDSPQILPGLKPSVTHANGSTISLAELSREEPRPTRRFDFTWKPKEYTLRIMACEGTRRVVRWVGLGHSHGPNTKVYRPKLANESADVGTQVDQNSTQVEARVEIGLEHKETQVEAHTESDSEPTSIQVCLKDPVMDGPIEFSRDSGELGESSRKSQLRVVDPQPHGVSNLALLELSSPTIDAQEIAVQVDSSESGEVLLVSQMTTLESLIHIDQGLVI